MFKFNTNLLRVQYVHLMSVTSALGGAVRIVDDENPNSKGLRFSIPFAVARAFIKRNKTGTFYVPIQACIVWYGDKVVNIEKRSTYVIEKDDISWQSACEHVINRFLIPLVTKGTQEENNRWYTDGISVYQIPEDAYSDNHEALTIDLKFKAVSVFSIKFSNLDTSALIETPATTTCVQFTSNTGRVVLSPPIWNNVADIRQAVTGGKATEFKFDVMNQNLRVNLEFVLSAAKAIGQHFGMTHTIPLQIDILMINLNTVNLPNLPKSLRETYSVNMDFTVAFAWLLSYCDKATDLDQYVAVRAVMKMLCTKGTFSQKSSKALEEFVAPKMIDPEEAYSSVLDKMGDMQLDNYFMNGGQINEDKDALIVSSMRNMVN
jgi:hypothetical protein